ncbi:O-antigen ligase family protein [Photobacterium nomapromontoriensis]|uniref:O-antigen ligase family protein n=1 Tax=Photobacterium nomapromontoriensis TaxID=2910237 RepID=UPI003D133C70
MQKTKPDNAYLRPKNIGLAMVSSLLIGAVWYWVPHPIVALALALLPMGILVVLGYPFVMVVFFVVFSFFRIHEAFPQLYSLKIPLLLSLASIVSLFWHLMISQKIKVYWRFELSVMSAFFIWVTLGVFMASNRAVAMSYFMGIYWKIALMTFAIAWLTRTVKDFAFASRLFIGAGCLIAFVALNNKIAGIGLVEGSRVTIGRTMGSVLGDPNDLALVLLFPAAFALSLMLNKSIGWGSRCISVLCFISLFSAVIATQSRGGLLGILAVIGVFAYWRVQSKSLLLFGGALVGALLYAVAGISGRSSGGAAEDGIDESAMGRIYAWEAAYNMALDNPLFGVGLDNFFYNYFFYSKHWDGLNHAVHSTWFGVLAETGFVGFIIFITMITVLIRSALRSLTIIDAQATPVSPEIVATAQAVLTGLIGTVVSGTFLTQGFTWPIYILSALVCAIAQWVSKHTASSE